MQFRRLGFACAVGFMFASLGIGQSAYADIYMSGNSSVNDPGPIQFSTGVLESPGPTYYPTFAQPLPTLKPLPSSEVVTKAPTNPNAYQPQPEPYAYLKPNPPGSYPPPVPEAPGPKPTKAPTNPQAYKNIARPYVVANTEPTHAPLKPMYMGPTNNTYYLTTGSLRDNVTQIVAQSGWGRVIWNVPYDYRWVGNISLHAVTVQDALNQLLSEYPLQAVFYEENHIVDIVPRRQA